MNRTGILAGALGAAIAIAIAGPAAGGESTLKTTYVLMVGSPAAPTPTSATVLIEPGTVILPEPTASAAASGGAGRIARDLKSAYRLDVLATEQRNVLDLSVGKEQPLELPVAGVDASITLIAVAEDRASFELRLSEQGKVVARPRITVMRGQWATVGSRDGEAAPYLFLLVGPWTRSDEALAASQAGLTPPTPVERVPPAYPESARQARAMGIVVLRGTVAVDGSIGKLRVVESAGDDLDKAAIEAVSKWKFEPGRDASGKAVPFEYTMTLNFKLTK